MNDVELGYPLYLGLDGLALQLGALYYGAAGQNPVTNPVTVYWDAAGTQPAKQPISVKNGRPSNNGAPARVFVTGAYSKLVLDSKGRQVAYEQSQSSAQGLRSDLAATSGASQVGFDGGTAQDVLDGAKTLQSYAALRAYSGRATSVRITGSGVAGQFFLDAADTTSADNGGTIIVDASGHRWKRLFFGPVNVRWFGAAGDGVAHDAAPINATLTYAAANGYEDVYLPPGTYMLETTVAVPPFVGLRGAGFGTKLSPLSAGYRAITVPGGVTASTEGANAHGLIADFVLDGKGVGTDGMWLEVIAYRSFARLKIRNFTGNGLELNDSQNSDFQQLEIRGCGVNLLLSHGCGSNDFIKCQFTGAATADIKFTGLGGDPLRQFANPTYNTFRNCIVEPLDLNKNTTGVVITEGTNNAFYDCQFVNGKTSKIAISNPVVGTKFTNCMFFGLAGNVDCAIDNSGFRTEVIDPYFLNLGDNEVVKVRNLTLVKDPTYSSASYFITNYTANQDTLRIDEGALLHGTTAQRPAAPGIRIAQFYDTTLGKPIWWNGSAWKDATGAAV